jgi:hypothetical protein
MPAVRLDEYVLETLLPSLVGRDRLPSAFLVYLALWHRSRGAGRRGVTLSLRQVADATGLSRRAVQDAVTALTRRRLISVTRAGATAVPTYAVLRPWIKR